MAAARPPGRHLRRRVHPRPWLRSRGRQTRRLHLALAAPAAEGARPAPLHARPAARGAARQRTPRVGRGVRVARTRAPRLLVRAARHHPLPRAPRGAAPARRTWTACGPRDSPSGTGSPTPTSPGRSTETALASSASDAPGVAADLVADLPARVPDLELLDVAPTVIRMPDRELYAAAESRLPRLARCPRVRAGGRRGPPRRARGRDAHRRAAARSQHRRAGPLRRSCSTSTPG